MTPLSYNTKSKMERRDVISVHITSSALRGERSRVRVQQLTQAPTQHLNRPATQTRMSHKYFLLRLTHSGHEAFLNPRAPSVASRVRHTQKGAQGIQIDTSVTRTVLEVPGRGSSGELFYRNPINGKGEGSRGRLAGDMGTSLASGNCHHAGNLSATQNAAADKNIE